MTSTAWLASARVTKVTSGFSRGSRWQRSADISMVVIPADAIWAIASSIRARAKSRDEIIRVTTPNCGTRRAAVGYAHMTTAHLDAPRIQLPRRRLVIVTAGLLLSMALSALDTSIVATAMPRIIAELSGLQFYAWVTTAYLVTSTTVIPISGKLGDLFGRKRFVQGGMIGFLVASALCGLAGSMPQLVVARAIQGIFGGFLTSSVVSSMADLYTPATRAKIQGVFMSVFATAAIAGPILGGILTDTLGWRYVFYVNLPLGILATVVVALTMPQVPTRSSWRNIDARGAILLTAGLVPLLIALSETRDAGWTSPVVLGLLAFAAVMLALFVWAEAGAEHAIIPLPLF